VPYRIDEADKVDEMLDRLKPKCMLGGSTTYKQILIRTSKTVVQLDRLHAKHVLPGFSDKSAEEREIAAISSEITRVSWPVRLEASSQV
jgi:syntaxin 16